MTNHANISLKVARILYPNMDEWYFGTVEDEDAVFGIMDGEEMLGFDYRTDAAGFQMAKWLVAYLYSPKVSEYKFRNKCVSLISDMNSDDPNLALATAIIELREDE